MGLVPMRINKAFNTSALRKLGQPGFDPVQDGHDSAWPWRSTCREEAVLFRERRIESRWVRLFQDTMKELGEKEMEEVSEKVAHLKDVRSVSSKDRALPHM